jgi:hypothetical protein
LAPYREITASCLDLLMKINPDISPQSHEKAFDEKIVSFRSAGTTMGARAPKAHRIFHTASIEKRRCFIVCLEL